MNVLQYAIERAIWNWHYQECRKLISGEWK